MTKMAPSGSASVTSAPAFRSAGSSGSSRSSRARRPTTPCTTVVRSSPAAASSFIRAIGEGRTRSRSTMKGELFAMTGTIDVLRAIAEGRGPRQWIVALGYAGWGEGQLDEEMTRHGWFAAMPTPPFCSTRRPTNGGARRSRRRASIPACWRARPARPEGGAPERRLASLLVREVGGAPTASAAEAIPFSREGEKARRNGPALRFAFHRSSNSITSR